MASTLCGRKQNQMDKYNQIRQKTVDKNIPFNLDWELTYRCNLKCKHCYQTGEEDRQELSKEEIFKTLDDLAAMGCLFVTLSGGEIFLRDDLIEIIKYLKSKGFAYRLLTNATLIDDAKAKEIAALKPLSVEVSIYAMDEEIHDWMTGLEGSFKQSIAAIEMLRDLGVNVRIKSTIVEKNKDQIQVLKDYAQSIEAGFTYYIGVVPQIDGNKGVCELNPCIDSAVNVLENADYNPEPLVIKREKLNYQPLCAAGHNALYISPYGDVFPCVLLRKLCGNIMENNIKDIWFGKKMEEVRNISFADLKDCQNCEDINYCNRCPGVAFLESGSLTAISKQDCFLAAARRKRHESL